MRHTLLVIIALTALSLGCDPPAATKEGDLKPEPAEASSGQGAGSGADVQAASAAGALVVGEVTVKQNVAADPVEDGPTNEDVQAWSDAALGRIEALERSPKGPPLVFTWMLRGAEVEGELDVALASVQLEFAAGDEVLRYKATQRRMVDPDAAEEVAPSGAVRTEALLLERMVLDLFMEFEQDHAVRVATDAELGGLLRLDTLLRGAAAARALTRARGPIVAGEFPGGAGVLRRYLAHDDAQVVLMVAGALVEMEDVASGPAFVKAATRLSRDGELTGYTALLFQLGLLGGEEVNAYLGAMCAGHPNEVVRADACAARVEVPK